MHTKWKWNLHLKLWRKKACHSGRSLQVLPQCLATAFWASPISKASCDSNHHTKSPQMPGMRTRVGACSIRYSSSSSHCKNKSETKDCKMPFSHQGLLRCACVLRWSTPFGLFSQNVCHLPTGVEQRSTHNAERRLGVKRLQLTMQNAITRFTLVMKVVGIMWIFQQICTVKWDGFCLQQVRFAASRPTMFQQFGVGHDDSNEVHSSHSDSWCIA